jgi:O-antigen/teichoic acid export membrane protein
MPQSIFEKAHSSECSKDQFARETTLLSPPQFSLKRRVFTAGSWSMAGYALSYVIRLGSSMVMTRLLIPEMFGVMAIAWTITTGLVMFSDVGLRQNIIQSKRGGDAEFLNTAWIIQIMRALLIWFLAACTSVLIFAANRAGLLPKTSVYGDPYLPYVITAVSASIAIGGFKSTKYSQASRDLLLGRVTLIEIVAQVAGLIFMICWVLIDRSIWALAAGAICSAVITTLLSHTWLPGVTNRWHWDPAAFHEIIHFGKWMFLSSILGFFAGSSDRIFLGGLVDSTTLGIYFIAATIYGSVIQVLSSIIGNVSYSALSEVARERPHELKRTLYRFHIVIAAFTYFCAGALMISGNSLIWLLYDRRYEQAGWMLEVLSIALLVAPFNVAIFCLLARGLPKIFTFLIGIRVAMAFMLIPLGFHFFGIQGALWAIVASQLSSLPATIYYQLKYDLFDLSKELMLLPALLAGMILAHGFSLAIGHP